MKIGARTIKTALAVTLTIVLINLLEAKIATAEYNLAGMAAVTAIIGMQPSIKGSLETFKNRVIATFIGTFIAFVLALTLGLNAFSLGFGSIAIVLICLKLGLNESIRFALITLAAVGVNHNEFNTLVVIYRVTGMLIGLSISTGLNIVFMPPDYTEDLKGKINNLRLEFEQLFKDAADDLLREEKTEKGIMKDKRQIIRDELDGVRDIYALLVEDVLSKNKDLLKHYRRSINAIQSNLERLMALHRSIVYLPEGVEYSDLRRDLYFYLEYLLLIHQQIYNYIALGEDFKQIAKNIDPKELKDKIVKLIKTDDDESVFEFYNIYSEATRINEKLEQLQQEFKIQVNTKRELANN